MKGKRMLVCLCVVMLGLYAGAAADGFDLEGMSENELLALKEAVEQRLPTPAPQGIDLDAMDFDELTALRDAVVERLEPDSFNVHITDDTTILDCDFYIVGKNLSAGRWKLRPLPNSYTTIMHSTSEKSTYYVLDGRGRNDNGLQKAFVELEEDDKFIVISNCVILTPEKFIK